MVEGERMIMIELRVSRITMGIVDQTEDLLKEEVLKKAISLLDADKMDKVKEMAKTDSSHRFSRGVACVAACFCQ